MDLMTIILISLIAIQLILTIVISILFRMKLKTLISQNSILMNIIYPLTKELREINYIAEKIDNVMNQLTAGLSTKENQPKTLPTPDVEEQITRTIKDQIATEVALASELRSPYKDSLRDIIFRTVETYPDISIEYIARKVISMVEMYSK